MNFWDSIKSSLYKYVEFTGRASRQEFWYFQLFLIILLLISMVIDYSINPTSEWYEGPTLEWYESPAYLIVGIIFILPSISLMVRRLRDINKSWLWVLLFLIAEYVLVFSDDEKFLVSVDITMMDYFIISSIVIGIWSLYWLGFKKGN
jgi:uncharacterized membrane protein YhaH (DUF805 family)